MREELYNRRSEFDASTPIDPETRRTARRIDRLRTVIEQRQFSLHLVLENIHDPHNVSAILRTCDAVGVGTVHLVYTQESFPKRLSQQSSAGVRKWTNLVRHASIADCYEALRSEGCRIYATKLTDDAVDLYDVKLTGGVALVFGNEHRGISDEASELSDGNFLIPMVGFAESLNVSVACAVSLYETLRQRRDAGTYDEPTVSEQEVEEILEDWAGR